MEPFTLAELFAAGAQHTVEQQVRLGVASFRDVMSALTRRFGERIGTSATVVAELREQVIASITASENIPGLGQPFPQSYGINPAAPAPYQYTIIAKLPNPLVAGEEIEVPWTINSQTPLSYADILAEAEAELNAGYTRPDRYNSAIYADLHRRDIAFRRTVQEQYGGNAPIDVEIIGAYRRG
jgi:hypothetical protein